MIWRPLGIFLTITIICAGLTVPSLAQTPDLPALAQKETDAAVQAMQTWLGLIDTGDYAKSWLEGAKGFQNAVTSDKWVAAVSAARSPVGKMSERKLIGAVYQVGLLDGGDFKPGQFVVAQFNTIFDQQKVARETVTFEKQADGSWRASGYYIRAL